MKVADTKIDATAAKNAPGVSRGVLERPWGPSEGLGRAQGTPCKALPMRNVKNELRGTHIKIPASPFGRLAGIFMCVPLRAFLTFRIGSALQGVPWALSRPP